MPHIYHENLDKRKIYLAFNSLMIANTELSIAAVDRPAGKGCVSMQEAVKQITTGDGISIWSSTYSSNSMIHPNPEWGKWRAIATNNQLYLNDLAAFCDPAIGGDGSKGVFIGVTFQNRMLELTNPPSWPAATEWLKVTK
jgi:hypothetical protein